MEHISKMIIPPSGGKREIKTVEVCEVCGTATKITEPLWGQVVPVPCKCVQERKRKEEEARQRYEAESRRKRDSLNSLQDAKGRKARFENLTVTAENKKYIAACKRYCDNFTENAAANRSLLFYGGTGRGKTTLAHCIANRLIDNGNAVKAVSINDLIQAIKDSFNNYGDEGKTALLSEIKSAPLFILDDLGAEYKTEWTTKEVIYDLIDARYRAERPTIITTNLSLQQLKDHLTGGDGVPRSYDRLIEDFFAVEFNGNNYRVQKAVQNEQDWFFFDGIQ